MKIVRGRLFAGDVTPTNLRYDPDCDCVQFSPDGGETWVTTPEADPRHSAAYRLPALATSDPQCDAAANMVKWLKDFIDSTTLALGDAASAFTVANIALEFFTVITGGSSILLDLIFGIGETLTELGYAALSAAFNPTEYDLLLCDFYCNIDLNGQMDATQLTACEAMVSVDLNTTAALVVNLILSTQGEVGVSNAGVIGGQTGDCTDCACAWCYEWPDVASMLLDGWFYSYHTGLTDILTYSDTGTLTRLEFNWSNNGIGTGGDSAIAWFAGVGLTNRIDLQTPLSGIADPYVWTGSQTFAELSFGGNAQSSSAGTFVIDDCHLEGIGSRPPWTHGSEC